MKNIKTRQKKYNRKLIRKRLKPHKENCVVSLNIEYTKCGDE